MDIKRKLTSRKFWVALAGFVAGLIVAFGGTDATAAQVTALIMAGACVLFVNEKNEILLQLREDNGFWEPYTTLTVNLCDARSQNASFAYVDTNNLPTAPEFLVGNGLATYTGACGTSGFCTYPLFAFTGEFFAACADGDGEVR